MSELEVIARIILDEDALHYWACEPGDDGVSIRERLRAAVEAAEVEREATFSEGSMVKRADADARDIPEYRNMKGTVISVDRPVVRVHWDCDPKGMITLHCSEHLVLDRESDK